MQYAFHCILPFLPHTHCLGEAVSPPAVKQVPWFYAPFPHAWQHTCRHMRVHVHTCLQRLSCEAEVTGLWFHATLSKFSANCTPSLLESNRDPTWAICGPQDRVISLAMWEERTTKGCSPWYMSHLNKIHEQNNQGFNSTVYSASTHELAFGSRPRAHGEVGVVSMTAD